MKSIVLPFLAGVAMSLAGGTAVAAFPDKPVRIIVPFGTGAMIDIIPREVATVLSKKWGQPVVVENKPGAASMIGAEYVARSKPDGYTLLMASSSTLSVAPFLYKNLRFDPLKDLVPVTLVSTAPNILMVSSALPVSSLSDLIRLAKEKPGQLSYASAGVGGIIHLQTELFKRVTGTDFIHVPYPGSQQAVGDLATNRVQLMIDILASNYGNLQDGRLKPLVAMTSQRLPQYPNLPTVVEEGYPDLVTDMWFGLAVPKGTPQEVIQKLQTDISAALNEPAFKKKYADMGMNMVGSTPEEMQKVVDTAAARWKKVIEESKISIE
ncbi:Bug family tripartite tricarboxylate transporter substrate binding protein [Parapusillimonas granuli]|uniref:Tripartite tricarboxylate transporter substrate binding protein n=1 Tax=Parapusillimonas granuli TaxID=380911 RepID=A0A853FT87_9BURK|nr:tripartite tricarboxylate transporter substrate binding protein [Parapusillimonas granuli]MBB5216142.1 tripartite-type tricarboxylate transporter receptor subunit TctC [Parapusillimonas granuli]NYT47823.1 tripartite tricarboxylate transporter substrate binding protein [Parapusillimonas granuli]